MKRVERQMRPLSVRGGERRAIGLAAAALFIVCSVGLTGCSRESAPPPEGSGSAGPAGTTGTELVATAQQALKPGCITIQRGVSGAVADAQISSALAGINYGSSPIIAVQKDFLTTNQGLFRFDLGAIPPHVNITKAHAQLQLDGGLGNDCTSAVRVHQVTASWTEGTVTWKSFGESFSSTVAATTSNSFLTASFDIPALAQQWVNGTAPNYGVLLEKDGLNTLYASSEDLLIGRRPELTVCFDGCAPGFADCDGNQANGCETNLETTTSSCGACGHVCSFPNAGASCSAGACTLGACNAGFGNCDGNAANGCETNTQTNVADCGACGHACSFANAGAACTAGACTLGACNAGFGNCDGSPADGCEAPLTTDANCGACGQTCSFANAGASCTSGACTLGACNPGFGNCDGNPADGCETNLDTSAANCGACGAACSLANASSACAGGACGIVACNPGFGNCDGNAGDGCEAPLNTSNNCGACGQSCALPHATSSCGTGACVIVSCQPGFADCDGNPANGCEASLTTTNNCGACGKSCTLSNATATCGGGTCAIAACNAGFADCDGSPADGCEASLLTDLNNCGACGTTPPATPCATGEAGPCATGVPVCTGGAFVCKSGLPSQDCVPAPVVTITSPANNFVTNQSTVTVSGTVDQANATVTVGNVSAGVTGNSFSVTVGLQEGNNLIIASATNAVGGTGTASVLVLRDTSPPRVMVLSPADGAVINGGTVTVTGTVLDQVIGTVNAQTTSVTVNGVSAAVNNRAFQAASVPVALGRGTITVVAKDNAGNMSSAVISVIGDATPKPQILVMSGDNQANGVINTQLPTPLTVVLTTNTGAPVVPDPLHPILVTFTITRGNGALAGGARSVTVPATSSGTAATTLKLGSLAASASDVVQATAPGFVGLATFAETAIPSPTGQQILAVTSGANQTIGVSAATPVPLTVLLSDTHGNALPNQNVTFKVIQGGGLVNGQPAVTLPTDGSGRAFVVLAAGPVAGINSQIVEASAPGAPAPAPTPVRFRATTLAAGPPASTGVSGVTLTNTSAPIQNVLVSIAGTNLSVLTDAEGRFSLPGAPSGPVLLLVDGTTAGSFPPLSFELNLASGTDNPLDRPVYLPLLDTFGAGMANPTSNLVLTRPDVPGLVFTVPAGTATFVGNADPTQGMVQVTRVHSDKIPMTPPDGTQPSVAFAIMPATVRFNPPAPISFPNVEGRAPGEIVTIFSYDHDLGEFVGVGSAQVSEDGLQVVSGPGQGIVKGGWHVVPPVATGFNCNAVSACGVTMTLSMTTGQCANMECPGNIGSCSTLTATSTFMSVIGYSPTVKSSCGSTFTPNACSSAALSPPTPDIQCYACPSPGTGLSCAVTNGCDLTPTPGAACTRGWDGNAVGSLAGQTGTCIVPPVSAGGPTTPTPMCCPTANLCGGTGANTGVQVCCANPALTSCSADGSGNPICSP